MHTSLEPVSRSAKPRPIAPPQPARWQMTLVLWMMVYAMITGLGLALNPLLKERSPLVRNFVTTAIFVPVMVYGAFPIARKLVTTLDAKQNRVI
ncbi:MAG: hypothetical protein F6K42_02625 [Leptolyngbya sp. SIO1D8]|nr:hypothetical protein [Leptolyngbya sp. SIO1D8]